jgi:hypothetical protein
VDRGLPPIGVAGAGADIKGNAIVCVRQPIALDDFVAQPASFDDSGESAGLFPQESESQES